MIISNEMTHHYSHNTSLSYNSGIKIGTLSKQRKLQEIASMQAFKSPCTYRHGALITRGNVVYSKGYNTNMRTAFLGKHDCCMHAEMSVVNSFMNQYIRKKPKLQQQLHNYTVWCVRVPRDPSLIDNGTNYVSRPCNVCISRLREFGFGKIAFSNENGCIEILKLKSEIIGYYTTVQKNILNLIKV